MSFMHYFDGMTVLITGASSGFGEEFARQLAPHAEKLILVARRLDLLEALHRELTGKYPSLQVAIFKVDLADETDRKAFSENLARGSLAVDMLINNAGLGDVGKFHSADWNKLQTILEVNIVALTALTHVVVPTMRKRGRGAILNVSSLASVFPIPKFAVYAATKAYVSSFTEALRAELRPRGITVTSVCPGPVKTGFGAAASRKEKNEFSTPDWVAVTPQKVVSDALRGVARDQARVFPGAAVKASAFLLLVTPLFILRRMLGLYAGK